MIAVRLLLIFVAICIIMCVITCLIMRLIMCPRIIFSYDQSDFFFIYVSQTSEPFLKFEILKKFFFFRIFFPIRNFEKKKFLIRISCYGCFCTRKPQQNMRSEYVKTILIEIFITVHDRIRFSKYDDL